MALVELLAGLQAGDDRHVVLDGSSAEHDAYAKSCTWHGAAV